MKKIDVIGIAVVLAIVITLAAGLSIANQSNPSTTATTSPTTGQQGPGQVALIATDPPVSAAGVTHTYATYNFADVHGAASGQSTGWVAWRRPTKPGEALGQGIAPTVSDVLY